MEPLKNLLLAGLGVLGAGKDRVQTVVDALIDKGELTQEQGETVLKDWVERGKEEQDNVTSKISEETQKLIRKLNLVTRDDFDKLAARLEDLEKRVGGE